MKLSTPRKRSVISLDIGSKRIGLAYCDALHITVSILPAIKRSKDFSELNILRAYIMKHNIKGIIIGLPLDDKGELTTQAKDCKKYGLKGIVLKSKKNIFLDKNKCIRFANKNKIFIFIK